MSLRNLASAATICRDDLSGSIVFRFNGESRVTLHADGTVAYQNYHPDRDAARVLELVSSVLEFHSEFGFRPHWEPVVEGRMLELAERLQAIDWRHAERLAPDTVTDVRELVNWVLYRDSKVRESVVAALAGKR
jgi:hypothetical protein